MHDHAVPTLACLSLVATVAAAQTPPRAEKIPNTTTIHGVTLSDEYFWLRKRSDPVIGSKVMEHLKAERAYCDEAMAHTGERQQTLYDEMVARLQQTDMSVPHRKGKWSYYTRNVEGKPYKIYCRKPLPDGDEQVILDANKAAEGQRNFRVGGMEISPDGRVAAIAIDLNGAEKYELRFRDLAANADLPYKIPETAGELAWAGDSRTVFYTTLDPMMRPYRVYRHSIGSDPSTDTLVYEEKDDQFFVSIAMTRSERFVLIELQSRDTSEWRFIPANAPKTPPMVIEPREKGHEYKVEHHDSRFLILTNDGAKNFRLVEAPIEAPGRETWREIRAGRSDVLMERVLAFKNHFVLAYRQNAMPHLSITAFKGVTKEIETAEPSYVLFPEMNEEYDTPTFRYSYTSPITPSSV
jgi:oligopeptidase B